MAGIVLAGGENRRMGTDKAFLSLAGRPMIEHILQALRGTADPVIIVTNSPGAYAAYDARVTCDAFAKRGPLTGIYSGLLCSTDEYNMVVACDMPFLNQKLLAYMMTAAAGYDVTLPKVGDFVEPLHAVYRKGLLSVIEEHIKKDQRQIRSMFDGLRIRFITEEEIDRFDPMRRSFINLNTPEEYKEVACSDLECRS